MAQTQTIGVGAASLECTVNGSGDPLVVLANAGCSTGYLERFGERLPRSQIIAINMRGSEPAGGRSTMRPFILPRTLPEFLRLSSAALCTSSVMPSVIGSPAAWPLTYHDGSTRQCCLICAHGIAQETMLIRLTPNGARC